MIVKPGTLLRGPALWAVALVLLAGAPAFAQAHIVGTVKDTSDRPIKGATITAENPNASPSTYTTTTDRKGRFAFLAMRAGEWTFTIRAPGFQSDRRTAMRAVGLNPAIEVVLEAADPEPRVVSALAGVDVGDLQQRLDEAAALADAGKVDEAIARYKEIAVRTPALSSVHLQLAWLYERKGDLESAAAEYRRVLQTDPDNVKAKNGLQRVSAPGA